MESIGNTLALMVGGNYVNRFDLQGRSYEVIPQVPRADRLTPNSLVNYYVPTASGTEVPLSTLVKVSTATDPNALTQYNQLNSATFQAVPWPGVTIGQAVTFLEQQSKRAFPGEFHPRLSRGLAAICRGRQQARLYLPVRADRDLPGAGGAVREPSRPHRDPGERAHVDLRRAPAAVHGHRDHQYLFAGRARHPHRAYLEARHPDGRIRQGAAAPREFWTAELRLCAQPPCACGRS